MNRTTAFLAVLPLPVALLLAAPAAERENAFMNMASHLEQLAQDNPASAGKLTALAGTVRELAQM